MAQGPRRSARKHRRFFPGFLITLLWMTPAMIGMAGLGFLLGRHVLSHKLLVESQVQTNKPRPIRILSPDEAAKVAKDQASHVWTEGLRKSDVPKLEPNDADEGTERRTTRRKRSREADDDQRASRSGRTREEPDQAEAATPEAPASDVAGEDRSAAAQSAPTPAPASATPANDAAIPLD